MAIIIDMKAALVKQRKSTSHGTRHTKKVAGTTARRHVGTMAPRHHDGTTARLAAQTECVKIGVERKHHRATTKFYDKKVKLEQEDRYVRPQPFQYLCQTELGLSQLRVFATIRLWTRNELWLLVFWIQRLGADVPTPSSDNDSRCSRFLWDGTNGAVFKWRKPLFYCWYQFFTAKKKKEQGIANKKWSVPRLRRA